MNETNSPSYNQPNINAQVLPNGTATLVLGILSIVVCFICGIVALVISKRDVEAYKNNPELYTAASYSNIKAGRVCALIGIILQAVGLIAYIAFIAFFLTLSSKGIH